jgi:2-phospho-L-lactate/phosphoenolpyruvate guanylyltransferase
MGGETWIVVLVKEPSTAKTRLAVVLSGSERARLAQECAMRALAAARAAAPTLAVCAGAAAAALAERSGVTVVVESRPEGQNPAGARGLDAVAARGGTACLLLSSDLPLVETASLRHLLDRAAAEPGPLVVAAPALGREGTNALYVRPIGGFDLQFGDRSLPRFAAEAARTGRRFLVQDDPALALDLDEPDDLDTLARLVGPAGAGEGHAAPKPPG